MTTRMNIMERSRSVAVVAAVLLTVAAGGCRKTKPKTTAPPPVNVEVLVIRPVWDFVDTFVVSGKAGPNDVVPVRADEEGQVVTVQAKEGAPVRKGDPLVQLDDTLLRAERKRALGQLNMHRVELERIQSLIAGKLASKSELTEAENNVVHSEAVYEIAARRVQRARIVSPIDGVLNDVMAKTGGRVGIGETIAEIVDFETAKVVVDVSERDAGFLNKGDSVTVLVRPDDRRLTGTITFISKVSDPVSLTTRTEIRVPNRRGTGPGGKGRALRNEIVRVLLTRRVYPESIFVPLSALTPREHGGYTVYLEKNNVAIPRTVQIDFLKGEEVRIASGLRAADRLITTGHQYVGPGQAVAVRRVTDPATAAGGSPAASRPARPDMER